MVALGRMLPPGQFIRGSGQFVLDDGFDLRESQPDLFLTCRQVAQVFFERTVFAGHAIFLIKKASLPSPKLRLKNMISCV
jgi:hypothetical protein